jgi:phosphoribosylformylglycinamidine synthase subunit PurS
VRHGASITNGLNQTSLESAGLEAQYFTRAGAKNSSRAAAACLMIRWRFGFLPNNVKAKITVTPKKAVLDPQGKTVQDALAHMGYKGVKAVHVGKYLEIELQDGDKAAYQKQIDEACHKLLSNPVIEDYHFTIE